MHTTIITLISREFSISEKQVKNTLELLLAGSTIPFISRYRKEATGALDEVQVGNIKDGYDKFTEIEKRKETESDWANYKRLVWLETEHQWRENQGFFNHYNRIRGKNDFHIDHQFSIRDGYEQNIDPKIIGHWVNLWMLPWYENLSKGKCSTTDATLLYANYYWAKAKFNEK